jgi:hypothetical protein
MEVGALRFSAFLTFDPLTTKNSRFLDCFKPSRNGKKTVWNYSGRFKTVQKYWSGIRVMDSLGPNRLEFQRFGPNHPDIILDGLGKTVQNK